MAVEVNLFPRVTNIDSYSVTEDAVPIAPGDLSAGTGTIAVNGDSFQDDVFLIGEELTLTDDRRGSITGRVTGVDGGEGKLSLSAYNVLGRFNVVRTIPPSARTVLTNYFTNPKPAVSGWTTNGRGGSITTTYNASGSGLGAYLPGQYLRTAWTSAATSHAANIITPTSAGVIPLTSNPTSPNFVLSMYVRTSAAQTLDITFEGGSASPQYSTATVVTVANTWTLVSVNFTLDHPGTLSFGIGSAASGHLWTNGETLDVSAALLTRKTPTTQNYFDGSLAPSTGGTPAWTGATNDSASTLTLDYAYFGDVFLEWCDAVGITSTTMSGPIAARAVVYPGWVGNVWEMLKNVLAVEELELYVVGTTVGVREIRSVETSIAGATSLRESVGDTSIASYVDVNYYNNTAITQEEVYPVPGEDPMIIQVNAGEVVELEFELKTHLVSVNQPVCIDFVEADANYYNGTNGAYAVAGNDDRPILASEWTGRGGSLAVALTDDPKIVKVTVRGGSNKAYEPYRIAMTSGNFYNALRITGDGVRTSAKTVRIATGADPDSYKEEVGATIENPFISTLGQAIDVGSRAAAQYTGISQTISVSTGDVDEDFGSVAGARILQSGANFRTTNVTYGPGSVGLSAQADSTLADLSGVWGSSDTLGMLQTQWSGKTLKELLLRPLRRT